LKEASAYEDVKANLGKKYWLGHGNLIIKGAVNFAKLDQETHEEDRLKHFALMRLERWGVALRVRCGKK
jgi:hypothetical protein